MASILSRPQWVKALTPWNLQAPEAFCWVQTGIAPYSSALCDATSDQIGIHTKCGYRYNARASTLKWLTGNSTMICKLVDLKHQTDCRIPNWVSAKTVHSSTTNHGQNYHKFPVILPVTVRATWPKQKRIVSKFSGPYDLQMCNFF